MPTSKKKNLKNNTREPIYTVISEENESELFRNSKGQTTYTNSWVHEPRASKCCTSCN
jgi:hypothetical protein